MSDTNSHGWRQRPGFWFALFALLGAFCWSEAALAQTTIRIGDDFRLTYEDGSLDGTTASGRASNVSFGRGRSVIWTADSIEIDARGSSRSEDWYVERVQITNFERPRESLYIEGVELRDLALGRRMAGKGRFGDFAMITEDSSMRLAKSTTLSGALIVNADSIATTPFVLTDAPDGTQVIREMGLVLEGIGVQGRNELSIDRPRDQRPWIAMDFRADARFDGDQMFVEFTHGAQIRELAEWTLAMDIAADDDFYSELEPVLIEQGSNLSLLGLAGAGAFNGGEFVMVDTGLISFVINVLASNAGISSSGLAGDLFRSSARGSVKRQIEDAFPDNADTLFPPIDAMLQNGGRLTIAFDPDRPVPFINMLAYALGFDRAIDELGVRVSHQP